MATPTPEISTAKSLLISLEDMHCLADGSLSRILGIAKCAMRALETESGARDLEALAQALQAIILDAEMTHNDIGCEAQNHGIQTLDPRWLKRLDAMSTTSGRA